MLRFVCVGLKDLWQKKRENSPRSSLFFSLVATNKPSNFVGEKFNVDVRPMIDIQQFVLGKYRALSRQLRHT